MLKSLISLAIFSSPAPVAANLCSEVRLTLQEAVPELLTQAEADAIVGRCEQNYGDPND